MDKLLLIVSDWNLRQLYHELLFSKNIEVVPTENIGNAVMFLSVDQYKAIVVYVDDEMQDMELFLHLRKQKTTWLDIRIILLTSDTLLYQPYLTNKDVILDSETLTPQEIAERVKSAV